MSALVDSTNTINTTTQEETPKVVVSTPEKITETAVTTDANDKVTSSENGPVESTVDKKTEEAVPSEEATEAEATETAAAPVEQAAEVVENDAVKPSEDVSETAEVAPTTEEKAESPAEAPVDEVVEASKEASSTEEKETPMEEEVLEEISPEETKKKMSENLVSGRRFMKTNAFQQASEALSVAAALAAEIFGEGHEDTFEVNFLYGKALLELAKIEDGVLTNALTDMPKATEGEEEVQDDVVENPDNVPQEEREDIKQKVEEALGVKSEEVIAEVAEEAVDEKMTDEETVEAEEKSTDDNIAETEVAEDVEMEAAEEQSAEDTNAEQAEESDSEDDGDSMKLAWELLETSRCICEKKLKALEDASDAEAIKSWKLNHAEVLTSLGEHGVADSKYEQAQKDLAEAVAIQSAILPVTSRILANTTHLLAKAFTLDALFEKATTHYEETKTILLSKVDELKKQISSASEEEKEDIQTEIKELEELIPELDALIVDSRASAEQTEKIKATAKQELESTAAEIAKLADAAVTDITDLVRRPTKRAASEGPTDDVKKRKSEDGATTIPDDKATEANTDETESAPAPVTQE